jgi:uncharacterized protein
MKKSIFAAVALALVCLAPALAQQTAPADEAAAKRQDIRRLLEATGSAKLGQQVLAQMLDSFKSMHSNVPEEFWDQILQEFDADSMIQLIIPIYDKHLTHDDIKGLLAFYESPLGRKMVEATPDITKESLTAGQQWGMEIARKVQKRLEERPKDPKGK